VEEIAWQQLPCASSTANVHVSTIVAEILQTMTPLPVSFAIFTAGSEPVAGGKVSCFLTMPTNSPPLKEFVNIGCYKEFFFW
jgi:hypothetical protein